jgi:hypothetical protein
MKEPYLYVNEKEYGIVGSKESLIALAEMMISKAKIGRCFSASFIDGVNKPIRIILDTDLLNKQDCLVTKCDGPRSVGGRCCMSVCDGCTVIERRVR